MSRLRAALALLLSAVIVGAVAGVIADGRMDRDDGTRFGTTINVRAGESDAAAVERTKREIGEPSVVRLFSTSLPTPWTEITGLAGPADVVASFKIPPRKVLAGDADAYLRRWFAAAPTDRDVYWVYFHEPENDIESGAFTTGEYVRAWEHIEQIADDADKPSLVSTVVLMCWTAGHDSARTWSDYLSVDPPDVLAWDCYNSAASGDEYATPRALFDAARRLSDRAGSAWAIAELGSLLVDDDGGTRRAEWLYDVAEYASKYDAVFVTYFNSPVGGDFELTDKPSQDAWRQVIAHE